MTSSVTTNANASGKTNSLRVRLRETMSNPASNPNLAFPNPENQRSPSSQSRSNVPPDPAKNHSSPLAEGSSCKLGLEASRITGLLKLVGTERADCPWPVGSGRCGFSFLLDTFSSRRVAEVLVAPAFVILAVPELRREELLPETGKRILDAHLSGIPNRLYSDLRPR